MKAIIQVYQKGDSFLELVRESMMPRDINARRTIGPDTTLSHFHHAVKNRFDIEVTQETTVIEAAIMLADKRLGL